MQYTYNDGLKPCGRYPHLYLAKGNDVVLFTGHDIDGFVMIITELYEKGGKWSNITFKLQLLPGVRPLYFLSPMHGIWGEEYETWGEVVEELQLDLPTTKKVVANLYRRTADRLDKLERMIVDIEKTDYCTEIVNVSFGAPTNRAIANGYWETPKSAYASDKSEVIVAPGENGWNNPVLIQPKNGNIISNQYSPGMHGGYRHIKVLITIR